MSSSSLYGINVNGEGVVLEEYRNSWLYAPKLWQHLFERLYTGIEKEKKFGKYVHYMSPNVMNDMYEKMMKWDNSVEQITYLTTMQYVFFTKDAAHVANAIRKMIPKLNLNKEEDHIADRFEEMAKHIEEIDIVKYPYFVFKNTSVDDSVELWFSKYDEDEEDEYIETTIFEREDITIPFVIFEDDFPKKLLSQGEIERVDI